MFYVNGTLLTEWIPATLSAHLNREGLASEVRDSQHYETGQYVRIWHADAHITLERAGAAEYLVRADGETYPALTDVCIHLSHHFSKARLRYKLEIYDEDDQLLNEYPVAL